MERNERFLQIAENLKPALFEKEVPVLETVGGDDYRARNLSKGDTVTLDFGTHLVGHVTLRFGYFGSHPDAPAWLRLKFAERECELSENAEDYRGWISMGWIQQEQIHIDVLPAYFLRKYDL